MERDGEIATFVAMLPSQISLIDRSPPLVLMWREVFAAHAEIEVLSGDYFQRAADAIVSPANSFGIMDGGVDLALRDQLGFAVQQRLQGRIAEKYRGEMPVGCAEIVATGHEGWKYLVAAPTMRVPEPVPFTIHSYLAFRAVLVAVAAFNLAHGKREIDSLVCCGLGTGIGRMLPKRCARQMHLAFQSLLDPPAAHGAEAIHAHHAALKLA